MQNVIEIEVDGNNNDCLMFGPINQRVRGTFEPTRVAGECTGRAREYGRIPGQRVVLDVDRQTGSVVEPLHEPQYAGLKERLTQRYRLPPPRQTFAAVDVQAWTDEMSRAVAAGYATRVAGDLPALVVPPWRPPADPQQVLVNKLAAVLDRLVDVVERLDSSNSKKGK